MIEVPKEVNGWTTSGTDLELLQQQPNLFSAEKNGRKLTIRRVVLAEGVIVSSPPTQEQAISQSIPGLIDWRLHWNGYDIARGRNLEQILQKALKFMMRQ